jgi:hypothetical protein
MALSSSRSRTVNANVNKPAIEPIWTSHVGIISPSRSVRSRPGGGWRNSDGLASFHFRGISRYAPRDAFAVHICHAVPIDALVLSFQIEQCAVVPCHDCS